MQPWLLNKYHTLFCTKTIVFILSMMVGVQLQAQEPKVQVDSISIIADSLVMAVDSLTVDSVRFASEKILSQDSIPNSNQINEIPDGVVISEDAIDAGIAYDARDSIVYDILDKKIYLYGNATVKYEDLDLKAGYIIVDWDKNEVFAEHTLDSLQKAAEIPNFKNADQEFDAKSIRYNFKSKKGIIYDAKSKYDDLFILGSRAKFLASDNDSLSNDHLYSSDALFTTCNLDHPHFGIRSKKQKIIPNKVVVIGPSNVEIMGIPTPLVLPFGFFPISESRTAGLIFPQDFEFSPTWGFGLRNVGYYTPINESLDMSLTGDLYFNGTYGIHLNSNYKKIYKYNGSLNLSWSERKQENRGVEAIEKSFSIRWSHSQDSRAHPTRSFSGSVNIQTNDYQSLNQNDAESVLQNSLSSNVNYRKSFTGKPYSFTASAGHSQNTRSNVITINLPTAEFKTQNMFLFKRKIKKGEEKWYEKISTTYNARFRNQVNATDTTLFTQETLNNIDFGLEQNISTSTSFKLLKYLSVSPSVRYREVWQPNSIIKRYDFADQVQRDTFFNPADSTEFNVVEELVRADSIVDINDFGFNRWNDYSGSVSINTQIFGIWQSEKGLVRGIRHLIKPSVSFSYAPSNTKQERGYFETLEFTDEFGELQSVEYGVFEGGIFGSPTATGAQANISYSLNNIFEAKLWSKKDTTINKIKIFDNLTGISWQPFRGTYSFYLRVNPSSTLNFLKIPFNKQNVDGFRNL